MVRSRPRAGKRKSPKLSDGTTIPTGYSHVVQFENPQKDGQYERGGHVIWAIF